MRNANQQNKTPYHLIVDEIEGQISAQDLQLLEDWKTANPKHLKEYSEIIKMHDQMELLAIRNKTNPDKAWKKFAPVLGKKLEAVQPKVIRIRNYYTWAGTAAVIFILMFVVGQLSFTNLKTISTTKNEHKKVNLPDGSQVTLNENTTLSYNKREFLKNRTVKLISGEAFFDVKHEQQHPFLINAAEANVRDIGTSFNVKISQEQIVVVVNSGEVALENPELEKKLNLSAKDRGMFNRKTKVMTSAKNVQINYKSWYDQKLSFIQTPLDEVAADLNDTFGTVIIFQDPDLKNRKLTAYFNNQSEKQIIEIITATLQLQVKKKGRSFVLYK
jgi:transmembrane sensor